MSALRNEVPSPVKPHVVLLRGRPALGDEPVVISAIDGSGRHQLPAFAVSIAEMFDGRRSIDEVRAGCASIGLPLSRAAVKGLASELDDHDLLSRAVLPTGRSPREPWSPATRALFRRALRSARCGEFDKAKKQVEVGLILAPGATELLRLRGCLERQLAASGDPLAFQRALRETIERWEQEVSPQSGTRTVGARVAAGAVLAGLALLGLSMVPLPRSFAGSGTFAPERVDELRAPRGGVVTSVLVAPGQRVTRGAPLLRLDPSAGRFVLIETQSSESRPFAPDQRSTPGWPEVLVAPSDGQVQSVEVTSGQSVEPGQSLLSIEDRDHLEFVMALTPRDAKLVGAGGPATLLLGGRKVQTNLARVSSTEAVGEIDNVGGAVLPGVHAFDVQLPAASIMERLR